MAESLSTTTTRTVIDRGAASVQELALGAVYAAVGSSPRGLSSTEAVVRLAEQGRNELPHPRGRSPTLRFVAQFTDLLAVVLLVAAGFTFLAYLLGSPRDVGNLQLTVAILAVVLLNAAIGFGQEYMAERTADALRSMMPHRARVVRDGERVEVPAAELVTGDVVVLEAGDAVSSDCRVIEAHELAVNNMALTGESEPAGRTAEPVAVDVALPAAAALVSLIEEATGVTDTVRLVRLSAAGVSLIETHIDEHSAATGHTVADLTLPQGTVVAAVVHNAQPVVPDGNYHFHPGDTVLVVTNTATETDIHNAFQ